MALAATRDIEQKRISITSKRQFTIPLKYFSELGFDREALCSVKDGCLVIKPVQQLTDGNFAEEILADLISEGFSGEKLLSEFRARQAKVRPAIKAMLEDAKKAANGQGEYSTYEDVFSSET